VRQCTTIRAAPMEIHRVLAALIEYMAPSGARREGEPELTEWEFGDDRGGSGCFVIRIVDEAVKPATMRRVIGCKQVFVALEDY